MHYAKSAKVAIALGATLVAMSLQSMAATSGSNINGIDAGNTAGIDAGNALGIDAGNALGIDAGNALGIDAGNALGIDAGNALGIDAGNALGIDAGNALGIDAGNALGIDAGNALGIDAGNALGIDAGNALGIDAGNALGIDAGNALIAGPVDAIDRLNGVFESMGQVVMASQSMLADLQVGAFVVVEGTVISSGWYYAYAVNVSDQMYIPGSTEVFVSGIISSVNLMNGTAQMGDLTIDYTPSLGGSSAPSGEMWRFSGIRPSQGGMMISDGSAGAVLR